MATQINSLRLFAVFITFCATTVLAASSSDVAPPTGWVTHAPRDEVRPQFSYEAASDLKYSGTFIITQGSREGQIGHWTRTVPISGGKHFRFHALRKTRSVADVRRSTMIRITWQDAEGKLVYDDPGRVHRITTTEPGFKPRARTEYPVECGVDEAGWTIFDETYHAPSAAVQAKIELEFRWAPGGQARWTDVSLKESPPPQSRKVKLATVYYRPSGGKTTLENCMQFEPLIARAAEQGADLVCLPEYATCTGLPIAAVDSAEPVPGPSTEYFGKLARHHEMYIIAGLVERADHLVFNTAVLIGPDGAIVGKYRKVCPTDGEVAAGFTPGSDYPVFDTRFGKVGMMICWDVFFPEVARRLGANGAEIIALPIAGGDPALAAARAKENQVYLLTSTLTDIKRPNWMRSGVFGHDGQWIDHAKQWGEVVVVEVDLGKPTHIDINGHFRHRVWRERP